MFNQNWITTDILPVIFLLFSANSDNNRGIFDRVIEQVLHKYGGQERCPWSRAIMEGELSM